MNIEVHIIDPDLGWCSRKVCLLFGFILKQNLCTGRKNGTSGFHSPTDRSSRKETISLLRAPEKGLRFHLIGR